MQVMAKDLKPKTDYYLTFDYWPKGGTKVRVSGMVPAKTIWSGQRGDAVKVKDTDGNEYFIHPKAWLFDQMPNVEVQRDSGSIIAGGSAGTTGSASGGTGERLCEQQ